MVRQKSKSRKVQDSVGYPAPIFTEIEPSVLNYRQRVHWAMLYANVVLSPPECKAETQKRYKDKRLNPLKAWRFITVGKYCWLLNNGATLSDNTMVKVNEWIDDLLRVVETEEADDDSGGEEKAEHQQTTTATTFTVQDRIKEQLAEYIGEIEQHVDEFTENDYKGTFKLYDWLKYNQVKAAQANRIADFYQPLADELRAIESDKQLAEGYNHVTKTERKRYLAFVEGLISDARTHAGNMKTTRKARKKKPKSAAQLVTKINYLKESPEHKLVSIAPESIIGAQQLWTFNVKYRQLTVLYADSPQGFGFKGTTVQGIDMEKSQAKRVRKPDEILPRVLDGNKTALKKIMNEIKTKSTAVTGRINGDTVLLKVLK